MHMANIYNMSTILYLFSCSGFLFFISRVKGRGEIQGSVGEQLNVTCEIANASLANIATIKVNHVELQYFDLKNNLTLCTENHLFHDQCMSKMKDTYRISMNEVVFVIKEAWQGLDGKTCWCFVKYEGYGHQDIPGPVMTIRLEGGNASVTLQPTMTTTTGGNASVTLQPTMTTTTGGNASVTLEPTMTTTTDTGQPNISFPNATNSPNDPAKKDNSNGGWARGFAVGITVGIVVGIVVGVAITLIVLGLLKKYKKPPASVDSDSLENGNLKNGVSTAYDTKQGENVLLPSRNETSPSGSFQNE